MRMKIQIPESEKIFIQAISIKCQCKKCGWLWGVTINTDGKPPVKFDECNRCKSIEEGGN